VNNGQAMNIYTFTVLHDGKMFSGRIPAMSWDHAQEQLPHAVVDGMLVEEFCAKCRTVIAGDLNVVKDYIWDEIFEA
jgi:hypothetical protein